VKAAQIRHQEAWSVTRSLTLNRQRHEQKATLLEWQLQNALAQLEKEKPGAALSRCLMTSRPRDLKERPKSGIRPRPNRDLRGGSDAGTESTLDADVSTAAGESVADDLLDFSHTQARA